jgi:SecD/SecF fusion protein
MNRNNFWRFVLVALVLAFAIFELIPPTPRQLLTVFQEKARNRDANFNAIVKQAQSLEKVQPGRSYENLKEAVGTNDLVRYFPIYDAKEQLNPKAYILNRLQRDAAGRIRLGLDLQGGIAFTVQMDTNGLSNASDTGAALSQAVEVLRKRVDRFGVAEPLIQPQGNNRILVQLPGLSAAEQQAAQETIKRAAFLEFKLVHDQSDELIKQGFPEPGYQIMRRKEKLQDGREVTEEVMVKQRPEMTGGVKTAMVTRGNLGEPEISFELDSKGADRFAQITKDNVNKRLAIILDGELYSAPVIRSPIENGRGSISGRFDQKAAFELANVLENPLRTQLEIIASRQVDPTLGKDSIRSGVRASIYGTLAVSGFMLVYYLVAGLVANVALIANIVILLGVMCSIGTTLTLPGIAGIVLTVGMAVDANVLIYERIREESAKGKSLRGAIAAGYDRAFGTIFDSHVTTLISSIILIFMGTGSIKGFGVSLTIGVAASLFTALVVTRMIFDFILDRGWLKSIPMLHIIRATKLDFMKLAKPAFIASWLLIAIGIGFGIHRGKTLFGRDFVGGNTTTYSFKEKIGPDQLRSALTSVGVKDALIQYQRETTGPETLRVDTAVDLGNKDSGAENTVSKVRAALARFPSADFKPLLTESVGPSVGQEIQRSAVIASLLSLFGILVYVAFRYEFSFAVGAVVAVIHDVLMTIGWYCLSGREFNATTVAAVLTIIGFSINDTIVIFDRIREDLRMGVRGSFREVMNQALNQTLSRTIITSGTVFLATASLYIFGGGEINDFAFTFLVGILTGTYSSIYIASALVLWWHKGQRPSIGSGALPVENVAPFKPQARQVA